MGLFLFLRHNLVCMHFYKELMPCKSGSSSCTTKSHVDSRYKRSLLRTMLDRAKRLSSTQDFLSQECKNLKEIFLKLKYPENSSTQLSIASSILKTQFKHHLTAPSGLRCHLKIRNRLTWFADNLAIWEQKSTNNYSRCLQAKRLLIT